MFKSFQQSLHERVAWSDLVGVAVMSVTAPWIAAYIHSACVFHRGFRLYNAEVGGTYFHGSMPPYPQPSLGWVLLSWIGGCGVPAILTFLLLLPFRKRVVFRWLLWVWCIAIWTWVCFKVEYAIH